MSEKISMHTKMRHSGGVTAEVWIQFYNHCQYFRLTITMTILQRMYKFWFSPFFLFNINFVLFHIVMRWKYVKFKKAKVWIQTFWKTKKSEKAEKVWKGDLWNRGQGHKGLAFVEKVGGTLMKLIFCRMKKKVRGFRFFQDQYSPWNFYFLNIKWCWMIGWE